MCFPVTNFKKAPRVKSATNPTFLFLSGFKFIIEFYHCFRNITSGLMPETDKSNKRTVSSNKIARAFEYKRNSLSRMSGSFFWR